jgi:transposase
VAHGHEGWSGSVYLEATIPHDLGELEAAGAAEVAIIAELRAANAAPRAQVAALEGANQALEARVVELERRLSQDSSNSSRPPSQDGLRKPTWRGRGEQTGRRPGKQPGAAGAHLAQVAQPDQVVVHAPARCAGCGGMLAAAPVTGVQARQVFDLPELRLRVVEHRVQRRRCGCGHVTAGVFPDQVRAPAQYGPGVRALGCYLQVFEHLPVERTARLLADALGAPVAAGTLAGLVAEGAAGLEHGGFLRAVREQLAAAAVVHFDETGARVAGRLHWVHSASTATLTLQTVHPKRGTVAMDAAGVLPDFGGVAVHDGWSPYRRYAVVHALCGAHLLRELDAVAEAPGQGWAAGMAELLADAKLVADRAHAAGLERVDDAAKARLWARYRRLLADGHAANPPPRAQRGRRARQRRSPAARLLARLDIHQDEVLRFLDNLGVPFDNNQAERDLRMVKLQQKISGCWRTLAGAQAFLAVRGYVSTTRKQGLNPLDILRRLFEGQPRLPRPAGLCG